MKRIFKLIFLSTILVSASKLDLGIGVGYISYPDYLGSNHQNSIALPFPYIDYRSKSLDIDKDGLKKRLFSIDGLSTRVSINGSLPIKSSGAREGMDNLDPAIEIGPAIVYKFYENSNFNIRLDVPIRAIISSDFHRVDYRGYKIESRLAIDYIIDDFLIELQTGPIYADSRYNNYIYGIKSKDILENRTKYSAKAGYLGEKSSFGISKKFQKIWAGAFIKYYNLNDSISANSPLMVKSHSIYSGLFIAYLFNNNFNNKIKNHLGI